MEETAKVYIEKLVYGGYGLGFYDNKVYMIENAYPEDFVEVEVIKKKKKVVFGRVKKVLEKSPFRLNNQCQHFPECGGCQWMDYNYANQLEQKQNIVSEQLKRIGNIDIEVNKIIASENSRRYRNRMEFAFGEKDGEVFVGLKKSNSHDIVKIEDCQICPAYFNSIARTVCEGVKEAKVPIYNPKTRRGSLKHLVLRKSFSNDSIMMILITQNERMPNEKKLKRYLSSKIKVDNVIHVINRSSAVTLRGPYRTWKGDGALREEFDGCVYNVPPTAFFQNNYYATKSILKYITSVFKKYVTPEDTLLDMYCGVGLFSIYFSSMFSWVTGVESSHVSLKAAKSNVHLNFLKNMTFIDSDSQEFLKGAVEKKKSFDFVIVDPPRNGLNNDVCKSLVKVNNKYLVYISCDPATLSRDLSELTTNQGYKLLEVQPVDMFPNTYHVETVVLMSRVEK